MRECLSIDAGHSNAMPDAGLPRLLKRHPFALHATGYFVMPGVAALR